MLISRVEKSKQRNNKATKGNQQSQYTYKNRNDFKGCHMRHPLSYVRYKYIGTRRQPRPVMGTFP